MKITRTALSKIFYLEGLLDKRGLGDSTDDIRVQFDEHQVLHLSIMTGSYGVNAVIDEGITDIDGQEPFDIIVNAIKFFATIKAVTSTDLTLTFVENGLRLSGGGLRVKLPYANGVGFYFMAIPDNVTLTACESIVFNGIEKLTSFCETRMQGVFNGVCINHTDGTYTYTATDRVKMYRIESPGHSVGTPFTVILPLETIRVLNKLPNTEIKVGATPSVFVVAYRSNETGAWNYLFSRLLAGDYPNTQPIFSRRPTPTYIVDDVGALIDALKLYTTVVGLPLVTIDLSGHTDNELHIQSEDFDIVEHVYVGEGVTEPLSVGLEINNLLLSLNSLKTSTNSVTLYANLENNSVFMRNNNEQIVLTKVRRF